MKFYMNFLDNDFTHELKNTLLSIFMKFYMNSLHDSFT